MASRVQTSVLVLSGSRRNGTAPGASGRAGGGGPCIGRNVAEGGRLQGFVVVGCSAFVVGVVSGVATYSVPVSGSYSNGSYSIPPVGLLP